MEVFHIFRNFHNIPRNGQPGGRHALKRDIVFAQAEERGEEEDDGEPCCLRFLGFTLTDCNERSFQNSFGFGLLRLWTSFWGRNNPSSTIRSLSMLLCIPEEEDQRVPRVGTTSSDLDVPSFCVDGHCRSFLRSSVSRHQIQRSKHRPAFLPNI